MTLLYFWLRSPEQAIERVAERVSKGGHSIPRDIIATGGCNQKLVIGNEVKYKTMEAYVKY